MPKRTNNFQLLIHKIYENLVDGSTQVTESGMVWDSQGEILREVDILIERKGMNSDESFSWMIECRDRSRKESIEWIDGLIGKSLSLNVNKVVAVSSKGFARSAIKKAAANGIDTITLKKCLDLDTPEYLRSFEFLLSDERYKFHIGDVELLDINYKKIDYPLDAIDSWLIRKRGTDEYIVFRNCIENMFSDLISSPTTSKILCDEAISKGAYYGDQVAVSKKMAKFHKDLIVRFNDHIFYDAQKKYWVFGFLKLKFICLFLVAYIKRMFLFMNSREIMFLLLSLLWQIQRKKLRLSFMRVRI